MHPIIETILTDVRRLAIVGVAKNCGKTTTLNLLLSEIGAASAGLVSIGIDGEEEDALIGTDKPTIAVREGQWVVTAQAALSESTARVEYVEDLRIATPLGAVSLCRVIDAGTVVLAGMRHSEDLSLALARLDAVVPPDAPILIDGAYGRTVAARADLSDGVLISTGAIVSPALDEIVAQTASLARRISMPTPIHSWQYNLVEHATSEQRALLGSPDGAVVELPAKSALLGLGRGRALWSEHIAAIAIPGLVSNRVVEELLAIPAETGEGTPRALVVPDGTVLQADPALMRKLERRWRVYAASSNTLCGVSINPTSVRGPGVDAGALAGALREVLGEDVPIFDPRQVRSG